MRAERLALDVPPAPVWIGVDLAAPAAEAEKPADTRKFNVGDRVRATKPGGIFYGAGDIGTVVSIVIYGVIEVRFDASPSVRDTYETWLAPAPDLELIPSPAAPAVDADGWVEIDGVGRPADLRMDAIVQVRCVDGFQSEFGWAGGFRWRDGGRSRITHYRICPKQA